MTPIQPVPELRLSSRFPTNADRPSGQWNSVVVEWGTTTRTMSSDLHLVAQNVLNNATAARELAVAAQASNAQALVQADRARDESDQAMGYRNTAGAHAATATEQAGIATTQAQGAAASAAHANADKLATQQIAQQAVTDTGEQVGLATVQAERAREAAESIAHGAITSVAVYSGLKTGAVTLGLSDMGAQATEAQMQAGTGTEPLLMSPAGVKAAVLAHAPKELLRSARTSNVQLVKADAGKLIDITSGTFTQTFAAAATLGSGWWCYLQNSGAGDITIPSSDGRTNWIMYPNEVRLFQCDGLAMRSIVLVPYSKAFTSSATYTKPPGYKGHGINAWKGGVAGQSGGVTSSTSSARAAGGVGSSLYEAELPDSAITTTVSVAIGSGGIAAEASTSDSRPSPSSAPGDTVFGSLLSTASWLSKLVTSTGFPTIAGSGGNSGVLADVFGSTTTHIGIAGTTTATSAGGKGGDGAYRNQQNGIISPATPGDDGVAPGGGGGGGGLGSGIADWATKPPAQKGGNGARGELRIWGIL